MLNLQFIRVLARAFYGAMILIGLTIMLFSLNAKADPNTPRVKPQTQTGFGGGDTVRRVNLTSREGAPQVEPILVNFSNEVRERVARDGQYVIGRESEAEALDGKLSGRGRTVAIQGKDGSGRTALVEEWIRINSGVDVHRVDTAKISTMDATDVAASLKAALLELERKNANAADGRRAVLYIDRLSNLQVGHGSGEAVPLNELWTQVNRGIDVPVIIETDEATLTKAIKESRYQGLDQMIDTLIIKPASFDAVVAFLRRNRPKLEQSGAKFLSSAFERAADIAVSHRRTEAFKWAYELMWNAGLKVQMDLKAGIVDQAALKGQITRQEDLVQGLESDLGFAANTQEKQATEAKLTAARAALQDLKSKQTAGNPDLSSSVSDLEARIKIKEDQLKNLDGGFFSKYLDSSSKGEREKLEGEIADLRTQRNNKKAELEQTASKSKPATAVGEAQIIERAAARLGVDAARLTANFEEGVRRVREISKEVYGQDGAIEALEAAFKRSAAGTEDGKKLTDAEVAEMKRSGLKRLTNKPISFWFFGPTGVGKTETAKQLADKTGYDLKILDMTDFTEKHSISRLNGAPPGYVGYEEEPELFRFVDEHPNSIIVLDEIEKAHPSIYDLLIPLLDEGRLTRANGKGAADFRNTILIITSNLAQKIGQWSPDDLTEFLMKKKNWTREQVRANTNNAEISLLRQTAYVTYITDAEEMAKEGRPPMRPEIARRVGGFIGFDRLTPENAARVAEKNLDQLSHNLKKLYGFKAVRFTSDVLTKVLMYFDPDGGGRNLNDAVKRLIRDGLSGPLLDIKARANGFESAQPGDVLLVDLDNREPGKLAVKSVAPAEIAKVEGTIAKAPPMISVSKEALLARRAGLNGATRNAWAATSALVRETFNQHARDRNMLIEERTFRLLKGRR